MNAIVTGSQVYGTPRRDSDVDLVMLVSQDDLLLLKRLGMVAEKATTGTDSDPGTVGTDHGLSASIRFGDLNLIATTCPIAFAVWQRGTEYLKRHQPNSRELAVAYFRDLRRHHGLQVAGPKTHALEPDPFEPDRPDHGWNYGDPVTFIRDGDERFGLITDVDLEDRVVIVSHRGLDYRRVPMTSLRRAKLTDGYRRKT